MRHLLIFAAIVVISAGLSFAAEPQTSSSKAPLKVKMPANNTFGGTTAGEGKELVTGMKFRWCPAGKFKMGSPASDPDHFENENMVDVTLTSGFWLGETEVTQGQWEALMKSKPWRRILVEAKDRSDYPASCIGHGDTWDGKFEIQSASGFCRRLTEQEQKSGRLPSKWKYVLPTEAQWEYACRAGSTTKYCFGDEQDGLGDYAWTPKNITNESLANGVGLKKANAWGLKDMYGNVREWCADRYSKQLPGGRDPVVLNKSDTGVSRGGSFMQDIICCSSAFRAASDLDKQFAQEDLGFRVAAVPSSD